MSEKVKAEHVSEYIEYPVSEAEVIEGHTPSQLLVEEYRDKRVLLVGSERSADVARSYGFNDVVSLDAYIRQHPYLVPYSCRYHGCNPDSGVTKGADRVSMPADTVPIALVLVFNVDDEHWKDGLQVCLDVLASTDGVPGHTPVSYADFKQTVKIGISNPDATYADRFVSPRFVIIIHVAFIIPI